MIRRPIGSLPKLAWVTRISRAPSTSTTTATWPSFKRWVRLKTSTEYEAAKDKLESEFKESRWTIKAVYEVADLTGAIVQLTITNMRAVIGDMDLDHTLSQRDQINAKLRIGLDEATDKWGVKVTRVDVKNINPPDDVRVTMEKQMTAERTRRAQQTRRPPINHRSPPCVRRHFSTLEQMVTYGCAANKTDFATQ